MKIKTAALSNSESAEAQREGYQKALEKLRHQEQMGLKGEDQKTCFKCKIKKHLNEFYVHPKMADGRLGKCKSCTKLDVHSRWNTPKSRAKAALYEKKRQQNPQRRIAKVAFQRKSRIANPEKWKARTAVSNAVRDGKLLRQPCVYCGNPKSQAHHKDYSRPLDVVWCCFKCHREIEHGQTLTETLLAPRTSKEAQAATPLRADGE